MKLMRILTCLGIFTICWSAVAAVNLNELKAHHNEAGLSCADCHVTDIPEKAPLETVCIDCHGEGDRANIADLTEALDPNPHYAHEENLPCGECHQEHRLSKDYCSDCHSFGFAVP